MVKPEECANFVNVEKSIEGIKVVGEALVHGVSKSEPEIYATVVLRSSLNWRTVVRFLGMPDIGSKYVQMTRNRRYTNPGPEV
jgi:hypothetical protein